MKSYGALHSPAASFSLTSAQRVLKIRVMSKKSEDCLRYSLASLILSGREQRKSQKSHHKVEQSFHNELSSKRKKNTF